MMNNIISYIIIFNVLINIHSNIVLPLETLSRDNYKIYYDINTPKDIIDKENRNNFFTVFSIGNPVQNIPLMINPESSYYIITSVHPVINSTIDPNKNYYNFSSDFLTEYDFFDENLSRTCKINWCRESEYYRAEECCSVNDSILFYEDINMKIKNFRNVTFEMMRNVADNITGEIGLNMYDKQDRIYNTFLGRLKNNKLITNYVWYFDFESWNSPKGKLVIGSSPHEDYPNSYSRDDLIIMNTKFDEEFFKISIDDVYIMDGGKQIKFNNNVDLRFDSNIIVGDIRYKKHILSKLSNLINEGLCFSDTIKDDKYFNDMNFFYCKNEENVKKVLDIIFSPIYLESKIFAFHFEITNQEILKVEGKYIYIQILFHDLLRKWTLGKLFSLKYKFVFNQENKQIGFYKKLKEIDNEIQTDYNLLIKIIIIVVLSIILISLGVLIGRYFYKSRKKRANELSDEDYEYCSTNNKDDKPDINSAAIN
jgi:hypothetical protein